MRRSALTAACVTAALLAGCASPRLQQGTGLPTGVQRLATANDNFSAAPGSSTPLPTDADLAWWHRFDDPALAEWVDRALAGNLDVAVATERTQQARALLRQARAARVPRLTTQAELAWQERGSASGRGGAAESGGSNDRGLQPGVTLGLDWDLDLWGGLGAAERAAAAGLVRSEELAQAARLSVAGLAARAYLEWRLAQADEQLLQQAATLLADALRIVSVRVEAGLSPVLDRDRARAELAANQADRAAAAVRAAQALAALQVVAGDVPRPGPFLMTTPVSQPGTPPSRRAVPALQGTQPLVQPLDLLRLRPDLRAAEQAVRIAAEEVGVTEAELLPRLSLPGSIVFGATGSGTALGLVSTTLAAALDLTLFDGGRRTARREEAESRWREAQLAWQQALLRALQQVEAALVAQQGAAQRVVSGRDERDAARAAQAQAETLYLAGLTNYLDVVDAQRSALSAERRHLQAQIDAAAASVQAFEAMGLMPPWQP